MQNWDQILDWSIIGEEKRPVNGSPTVIRIEKAFKSKL